jgi:hypothetical protein
MPARGRLRQEDRDFQATLGYTENSGTALAKQRGPGERKGNEGGIVRDVRLGLELPHE